MMANLIMGRMINHFTQAGKFGYTTTYHPHVAEDVKSSEAQPTQPAM